MFSATAKVLKGKKKIRRELLEYSDVRNQYYMFCKSEYFKLFSSPVHNKQKKSNQPSTLLKTFSSFDEGNSDK